MWTNRYILVYLVIYLFFSFNFSRTILLWQTARNSVQTKSIIKYTKTLTYGGLENLDASLVHALLNLFDNTKKWFLFFLESWCFFKLTWYFLYKIFFKLFAWTLKPIGFFSFNKKFIFDFKIWNFELSCLDSREAQIILNLNQLAIGAGYRW